MENKTKCSDLHDEPPYLGYNAWHDDAEYRHNKGQKQISCPACNKFIWETFYHHLPSEPIIRKLNKNNARIVGYKPSLPNPSYRPGLTADAG